VQALRAAGVPIVASWIDAPFNHDGSELSTDEWTAHWERCCREAAEADITLMYALRRREAERRPNRGRKRARRWQAGLPRQSPTIGVGSITQGLGASLPLEAAVVAIMAAVAGEKARQAGNLADRHRRGC
jgi:hypothetical protein